LFPNEKPPPGSDQQALYNQKHDALTNFYLGGDGHLYKQLTEGEKKHGKTENRRVNCDNEIFHYIQQVHLQLDHAGSAKVYANINEQFYGIKKDKVEWLLQHCQSCLLERQNRSRAPLEPIISDHTLQQVQIDLVDFCHEPDGQYK
jgi:hypothetical protein